MPSIAYTVNSKGEVWTLQEQGGGELLSPPNAEFAQDIGVDAEGTAWIVGTEERPGGAAPSWAEAAAAKVWKTLAPPAAAASIAVGPNGVAYTVNDKGEVWTLHEQGGGELLSPANVCFAQDIGVGADGTVWIVGAEARPGGAVPKWLKDPATKTWKTLAPPAAASRIAVGPQGVAYTVNDKGEVWTLHKQGGGELLSPANQLFAMDIGVGADGTVWIVSAEARPGGAAPKWLKDPATKTWETLAPPAAAVKIAVR